MDHVIERVLPFGVLSREYPFGPCFQASTRLGKTLFGASGQPKSTPPFLSVHARWFLPRTRGGEVSIQNVHPFRLFENSHVRVTPLLKEAVRRQSHPDRIVFPQAKSDQEA